MYISIPLILVAIALAGIFIIVWRKMPYLKKLTRLNFAEQNPGGLTPEAHEQRKGWWHSMLPEIVDWYRGIPFKRYRETVFRETEKLLRKIRLVFSQIDRISASLIRSVRRVHIESALERTPEQAANERDEKVPLGEKLSVSARRQDISPKDQPKKREHELIIEIAKNPKDPSLYESLGDIYVELGGYEDAKESFEAALEFKPGDKVLSQKLSRALEKLSAK